MGNRTDARYQVCHDSAGAHDRTHRRRPSQLPQQRPRAARGGGIRGRRRGRERRSKGSTVRASCGPSVVLLDVQLPDIDGFEVASRLTQDDGAPAVVLISSSDGSDFGHLVRDSGARGFIPKAELSGDGDRRARCEHPHPRRPLEPRAAPRARARPPSSSRATTSSSPWATAALATATSLGFVAAGLIAWARRPDNRTGILLTLVGFTWFVGALAAVERRRPTRSASRSTACRSSSSPGSCWRIRRAGSDDARPRASSASTACSCSSRSRRFYLVDDQTATCADCPENCFLVSRAARRSRRDRDRLARDRRRRRRRRSSPILAPPLAARHAGAPPPARAGVRHRDLRGRRPRGAARRRAVRRRGRRRVRLAAAREPAAVPLAFLYGLLRTRLARAEVGPAAARGARGGRAGAGRRTRCAARSATRRCALALWVDHARPLRRRRRQARRARPRHGRAGHDARSSTTGGRSPRSMHDAALLREPELLEEVVAASRLGLEKDRGLRALRLVETRQRALLDAIPDLMFRDRARRHLPRLQGATPTATSRRAPERGASAARCATACRPGSPTSIMAAIERALETGEGVQTVEYELEIRGDAPLLRGPRRGGRRRRGAPDRPRDHRPQGGRGGADGRARLPPDGHRHDPEPALRGRPRRPDRPLQPRRRARHGLDERRARAGAARLGGVRGARRGARADRAARRRAREHAR